MKIDLVVGDSLPKHDYGSRALKPGDTGTDVKRLQTFTNKHRKYRREHGLGKPKPITVDGRYGAQTEKAVNLMLYQLGCRVAELKRVGTTRRQLKFIHHPEKKPRSWRRRQRKRKES